MDDLYSRQTTLTLFRYQYVLIVGLGGIGNWVALDLALSGRVSNMILIDGDTVDIHNLNRTIFRYSDVGEYKVDAVKYQILERRSNINIITYNQITNDKLLSEMIKIMFDGDNSVYHNDCLIMDCRDDIYDDLLDFNCKLYKVGYDGTSMTIDGNPRLTKIFTQRGGSYSVVPSYIGSSQIVAALAVNDALGAGFANIPYTDAIDQSINASVTKTNPFLYNFCTTDGRDEYGRLNCNITFRCEDIFKRCSNGEVKEYDEKHHNEAMKILETENEESNNAN